VSTILDQETAIIGRLTAEVTSANSVSRYVGEDFEELLKADSLLPALRVAHGSSVIRDPDVIGSNSTMTRNLWTVLAIVKSIASPTGAKNTALELISDVRSALRSYDIGDGVMYATIIEPISVTGGIVVYGAQFYIDTRD